MEVVSGETCFSPVFSLTSHISCLVSLVNLKLGVSNVIVLSVNKSL